MNPEMRKQIVLSHEGQCLAMAGPNGGGEEHAREVTRCVIDGAFNALIRMEGAEQAAKFAFALSDRVVGQLRQPTELPVGPVPPIAKPKAAPALRLTMTWWALGFAAGLVVGGNR